MVLASFRKRLRKVCYNGRKIVFLLASIRDLRFPPSASPLVDSSSVFDVINVSW